MSHPQVEAECDCGWTWAGPGHAWPWINDSHLLEHEKGRGGLPATSRLIAREAQADTEPEPEAEISA
jgi:hypothetical protein